MNGVRRILTKNLFSKTLSSNLLFIFHFLIFALHTFAMQGPEVDSSLDELRVHFVREIGARSLGSEMFSLEIRGDVLKPHGIPQDIAPL